MAVPSACPASRRLLGLLLYAGSLALICLSIPIFWEGHEAIIVSRALQHHREEFVPFNGTCAVSFVRRCSIMTRDGQPPDVARADREVDGSPTCWASTRAVFSPPHSTNTFTSYPEYEIKFEGECSETCEMDDVHRMPSGQWVTGGQYACWKPTGARVDVRYRCGNQQCYKLEDPAELHARADRKAMETFRRGIQLGAIGLVVGIVSMCVWPLSGLTRKPTPDIVLKTTTAGPSVDDDLKKPLTPSKRPAAQAVTRDARGKAAGNERV